MSYRYRGENILNFDFDKVEEERGLYKFDLIVKLENRQPATRRMSVKRIGTDTGTRSKCFIVYYDMPIVVKIPPIKIISNFEYISILSSQHQIKSVLGTTTCLLPELISIYVLLGIDLGQLVNNDSKIHLTDNETNSASPEKISFEEQVSFFQRNSYLSEYFKVDGGFAFFLSLSKHLFLQNIIDFNKNEIIRNWRIKINKFLSSLITVQELVNDEISNIFWSELEKVHTNFLSQAMIVWDNKLDLTEYFTDFILGDESRLPEHIHPAIINSLISILKNTLSQLSEQAFQQDKSSKLQYL